MAEGFQRNTKNVKHITAPRLLFYINSLMPALSNGVVAVLAVYMTAIGLPPQRTIIALSLLGGGGIISILICSVVVRRTSPTITLISANASMLAAASSILSFGVNTMEISVLLAGYGISAARVSLIYIASLEPDAASRVSFLAWRRFLLNVGVAAGASIATSLIAADVGWFLAFWASSALFSLGASMFYWRMIRMIDVREEISIRALGQSWIWVFLLGFLCATAPFALVQNAYVTSVLSNPSFNEATVGNIFLLNGIMIACLQVPLLSYLQKWPEEVKILVSTAMLGVGVSSIALIEGSWILYVTVAIWTIGEVILFVVSLDYLFKRSLASRLTVTVTYQLCLSSIEFAAPLAAGMIIGLQQLAFWGTVLLVSCVGGLLLASTFRIAPEAEAT